MHCLNYFFSNCRSINFIVLTILPISFKHNFIKVMYNLIERYNRHVFNYLEISAIHEIKPKVRLFCNLQASVTLLKYLFYNI